MNKKLYKSRNDRAISGVCAGIAEYFDIDVVIVRLLAVILGFVSVGTALIVYIIAAVVIPEEPTVRMSDGSRRPVYETTYEETGAGGGEGAQGTGGPSAEGADNAGASAGQQSGDFRFADKEGQPAAKKGGGAWVLGLILILMGAYLIMDWFFPWISWRLIAAAVMIIVGIAVLVKR